MKKIFLLFAIIIIQTNINAQDINRDKETEETIEWLNSKLVEFKFKTNEVEQVFLINDIRDIDGDFFITGRKEQNTDNPLAAYKSIFAIPISKINSIRFDEKTINYWVIISMKNEEKAILTFNAEDENDEHSNKYNDISIMLAKDIDKENLRPRILKAFNYLLELYGNKQEEKF